jgi:hypothetical protein
VPQHSANQLIRLGTAEANRRTGEADEYADAA